MNVKKVVSVLLIASNVLTLVTAFISGTFDAGILWFVWLFASMLIAGYLEEVVPGDIGECP